MGIVVTVLVSPALGTQKLEKRTGGGKVIEVWTKQKIPKISRRKITAEGGTLTRDDGAELLIS